MGWSPLQSTSPSSTTLLSRLPWFTRPFLWLRRLEGFHPSGLHTAHDLQLGYQDSPDLHSSQCLQHRSDHSRPEQDVPQPEDLHHPLVSHITKREAEADPALVYTTAGVHQPIVYKTPLQTPLVYNTPVHTPLLKTVDNAVVPAVGGYIHSSHVGVCTNNVGIRVPC